MVHVQFCLRTARRCHYAQNFVRLSCDDPRWPTIDKIFCRVVVQMRRGFVMTVALLSSSTPTNRRIIVIHNLYISGYRLAWIYHGHICDWSIHLTNKFEYAILPSSYHISVEVFEYLYQWPDGQIQYNYACLHGITSSPYELIGTHTDQYILYISTVFRSTRLHIRRTFPTNMAYLPRRCGKFTHLKLPYLFTYIVIKYNLNMCCFNMSKLKSVYTC